MIEHGLYYLTSEYDSVVKQVGGDWGNPQHRPVVCLVKSSEADGLYWAIPMGNLKHRTEKQQERLQWYLSLPENDIRSCYYHIGRTTAKSIFFISDAIPITESYIESVHTGPNGKQFIIKNPKLLHELQRKLFRILSVENARKNYYRQHISALKEYMLDELNRAEKKK